MMPNVCKMKKVEVVCFKKLDQGREVLHPFLFFQCGVGEVWGVCAKKAA